jgi:hypothetical protein
MVDSPGRPIRAEGGYAGMDGIEIPATVTRHIAQPMPGAELERALLLRDFLSLKL